MRTTKPMGLVSTSMVAPALPPRIHSLPTELICLIFSVVQALMNLPVGLRGLASGVLQQGYAVGYLIAAVISLELVPTVPQGWRALFLTASGISVFGACLCALLPESSMFTKAYLAARCRLRGARDQGVPARDGRDVQEALAVVCEVSLLDGSPSSLGGGSRLCACFFFSHFLFSLPAMAGWCLLPFPVGRVFRFVCAMRIGSGAQARRMDRG
ncbi:hypothetical protein B0H14DRAFT_2928907 [Mycena olivaceomarginata]|nr:hypothetical protein B0H14DRAFT_2928907 [Mycena olivaceomarginata]